MFSTNSLVKLLLVTWIVVLSSLGEVTGRVDSSEQIVIDDLNARCKKEARPVLSYSDPVKVYIRFYLEQVVRLDESSQSISSSGVLRAVWTDPCRVWNASDHGNVSSVTVSSDKVWMPDIALENTIDNAVDYSMVDTFRVLNKHDGAMTWVISDIFTTRCAMKLRWYPFDHQECEIAFWTYMSRANAVMLYAMNRNVSTDRLVKNMEWHLSGARMYDQLVMYDEEVAVPRVAILLKIRREIAYYLANVLSPCVMVSFLLVAMFCMPPESGEKISLGTASLVTSSVFMMVVADELPHTREICILEAYLLFFMAMNTVSILLSVSVINVYYHDNPYVQSAKLNSIITCIARALHMDIPLYAYEATQGVQEEETRQRPRHNGAINPKPNDSVLDYDSGPGSGFNSMERNSNYRTRRPSKQRPPLRLVAGSKSRSPMASELTLDRPNSDLFDNSFDCRQIPIREEEYEQEEERVRLVTDWKHSARVLDRLLLVISLVLNCVAIVFLFIVMPLYHFSM